MGGLPRGRAGGAGPGYRSRPAPRLVRRVRRTGNRTGDRVGACGEPHRGDRVVRARGHARGQALGPVGARAMRIGAILSLADSDAGVTAPWANVLRFATHAEGLGFDTL